MVQERLDQMIRERQEARQVERRRQSSEGTKFIVMVALEKCSYDPREDFRESMVEMIMTNRIQDPKDLRSLLNYYVSMNSDEYHGTILEVFHEVCSNLFLSCKCHWWTIMRIFSVRLDQWAFIQRIVVWFWSFVLSKHTHNSYKGSFIIIIIIIIIIILLIICNAFIKKKGLRGGLYYHTNRHPSYQTMIQ